MFPKHTCSLTLTHNQHKSYYETVEKYFENPWLKDIGISPEDRQEMIAKDEIWELQWYPDTPVGFYCVVAPTLEKVLALANDVS